MAHLATATPGARGINGIWFTNNVSLYSLTESGRITVCFSSATALTNAQLQVTLDGGTNWLSLPTIAPAVNTIHEFSIPVVNKTGNAAAFNIRATIAITLNFAHAFT